MKQLYSKGSEQLQLPYEEYIALVEKVEEMKRLREVKSTVLADLQAFLGGSTHSAPVVQPPVEPQPEAPAPMVAESTVEEMQQETAREAPVQEAAAEKVSIEFAPEKSKEEIDPHQATVRARPTFNADDIPPIKEDIAAHFNKMDESGRIFNVFTQYYTCVNNACGGTVRVTMKDGFCSFWNYDAWEEFSFVDVFENELRIAVDPRYTDALKSLQLCEVPRLLSSRKNLICVKVDDLNQNVLDILVKAFEEVGTAAG